MLQLIKSINNIKPKLPKNTNNVNNQKYILYYYNSITFKKLYENLIIFPVLIFVKITGIDL